MSSPKNRRSGLRAALGAAVGAALLVLGAGSGAAVAAPTIDPEQKGTLTVHKFEQPDEATGLPNDGRELDPAATAGLTPLAGVEYTMQRVAAVDGEAVDLSTNAGWELASGLTPAGAQAADLVSAGVVTTDAAGIAAFTNLDVGLYLVTETRAPAQISKAAPFLVTIPLSDPTGSGDWLYNVHVYPKNTVNGGEKIVDDESAVVVGDTISYTITGDIPGGETVTGYKITDKLDTKLTYTAGADRVALIRSGSADIPLVKDTDYTVTFDAATNTVTMNVSAPGLAKLTANQDHRLKWTLSTVVNAIGEIDNEATLFFNEEAIEGGTGTTPVTPPVTTKFGSIVVEKVDAEDASIKLPDVTFKVYTSLADAQAGTNAVSIAGVSEWSSNAQGRVLIEGLRYSNWVNGAPVEPGDPGYRSYYLVETGAAPGYELLAQPVRVDVTNGDANAVDITIKNVQSNAGFVLPLTGGIGTTLLYLGGALLLAGVILKAIRNSRKERGAAIEIA